MLVACCPGDLWAHCIFHCFIFFPHEHVTSIPQLWTSRLYTHIFLLLEGQAWNKLWYWLGGIFRAPSVAFAFHMWSVCSSLSFFNVSSLTFFLTVWIWYSLSHVLYMSDFANLKHLIRIFFYGFHFISTHHIHFSVQLWNWHVTIKVNWLEFSCHL